MDEEQSCKGDRERVQDRVRAVLRQIPDPCAFALGLKLSAPEMGLVQCIEATPREDGTWRVLLHMQVTSPACMYLPFFDVQAHALLDDAGFHDVEIVWDPTGLNWMPEQMEPTARARLPRSGGAALAARQDLLRPLPNR